MCGKVVVRKKAKISCDSQRQSQFLGTVGHDIVLFTSEYISIQNRPLTVEAVCLLITSAQADSSDFEHA